jgi:hypothetical protein
MQTVRKKTDSRTSRLSSANSLCKTCSIIRLSESLLSSEAPPPLTEAAVGSRGASSPFSTPKFMWPLFHIKGTEAQPRRAKQSGCQFREVIKRGSEMRSGTYTDSGAGSIDAWVDHHFCRKATASSASSCPEMNGKG